MTENIPEESKKEHRLTKLGKFLGGLLKPLTPLGRQWLAALNIVGEPSIALTLLASLLLMSFKIWIPPNTSLPIPIDVSLNLIIAVFSGIAGGLIANKWSKLNETSILATRGKSAIRGLTLLRRNIAAVERRLAQYSNQLTPLSEKEDHRTRLFRFTYEELITKCVALQEEAINAIEEWQDIIPEVANLTTQLGIFADLKEEKASLDRQIQQLLIEISNNSNASQERINDLKAQLKKKEAEVQRVSAELREQKQNVQISGLATYSRSITDPINLSIAPLSNYNSINIHDSTGLTMKPKDQTPIDLTVKRPK